MDNSQAIIRDPANTNQVTDSLLNHSISALIQAKTDEDDTKLSTYYLYGEPLICLTLRGEERLCLAQISGLLLRDYSYNEIHNRRVALGITCVQCTPRQLEMLRRVGAMPVSSRRCGTITKREAQRLVESFLLDTSPPKLPEDFAFEVKHQCGWGCNGFFIPARYNSSRAKCVQCLFCQVFFSPNKFVFHCHSLEETGSAQVSKYRHPDAANFNAWRRHLILATSNPSEELLFAWEDVKAMFNGGNRKKISYRHPVSVSNTGEGMGATYGENISTKPPKRNFCKVPEQTNVPEPASKITLPSKNFIGNYRSILSLMLGDFSVSHIDQQSSMGIPSPLLFPMGLIESSQNPTSEAYYRWSNNRWLAELAGELNVGGEWTTSLRNYVEKIAQGIYLPPPPPPSASSI